MTNNIARKGMIKRTARDSFAHRGKLSFKEKKERLLYLERIENLAAKINQPAEGFFGPESMCWKIFKEPGLFVTSIRALLLQLAHPCVAEGVNQYSNFKEDAFGRAQRTFSSMYTLFFGDVDQSIHAGKKLNQMHYYIRGNIVKKDGSTRIFCANDPDLLLWVWATLIDSPIVAYEKLYDKLSQAEKEQFYHEMKRAALLLGIPPDFIPNHLEAFYIYYKGMLMSDELQVGETGLNLSNDILSLPYTNHYLSSLLGVGFLPERLISDFQLKKNKRRNRHFEWFISFVKIMLWVIPKSLLYAPPYYQAMFRVARLRGEQPSVLAKFFSWVSRKFNAPFCI